MFQQSIFQGPGTGTFTTHTFEILFMLGVAFLLGLWLGWVLWSRYKQTAEQLRVENQSLNLTAATLRGDMENLKGRLADAESERANLESQNKSLQWEAENHESHLTVLKSDLEKVQERNRHLETELGVARDSSAEGTIPMDVVVPVPSEPMEDLPDLEETIAEAVDEAFDSANLDNPDLEAQIAKTVSEAVSEHLENDEASALEPELPPLDISDEEAMAPPVVTFVAPEAENAAGNKEPIVTTLVAGPRDDLKIVEGVGPKIEELLFKAGITTYGQLAATSVQQLESILADAGSRFAMHDPGTWPAQALLAANGEWENLKSYQEFLHGGKRPDKG